MAFKTIKKRHSPLGNKCLATKYSTKNYSSFRIFGKNVILNFGEIITSNNIETNLSDSRAIIEFNLKLHDQLKKLIVEADPSDKEKIKRIFFIPQPVIKKVILFIPSLIGYIIHLPLYYAVVLAIRNRANDHYDSIMVGLLFIFYPLYLLAITLTTYIISHQQISWMLMVILPFTAWATLHLKRQIA
jgi:hypothetical protein